MKFNSILLLLLFTTPTIAQKNDVIKDSLPKNKTNLYIEDHKKQLNIKFDISNDVENYHMSFDANSVNIAPNQNIRYALDFNYKFASVRLGIRAPISNSQKEDKGDTYVFRFKIKLLFDKWSHQFEYNYVRGYYIKNSENLFKNDFKNHIQFPRLKTYIFSGSTAYKFNNKFSLRAISSQTEIQVKSVGSFMPSVNYWIYNITGTHKFINTNGELIERENYNNFKGFTTVLNMGYYYTFVYKKYWYAHAYISPGAGIDFYQVKAHYQDRIYINNFNNLVLSLQSGVALGYNSKKYYFGLVYNNSSTNKKNYTDEFHFNTSRNVFHVFLGYRFKAPKLVKRPIDQIQEMVPILNKN